MFAAAADRFSARAVGYGASCLGLLVFLEALYFRRADFLIALQPWRQRQLSLSGWLFILLALCFLSTLWALNPEFSIVRALKIAPQIIAGGALIVAGPAIIRATTPRDRQRWLLSYALALSIIAADLASGVKLHYWLYHGSAPGHMRIDALNRSVLCSVLFYLPSLGFLWAPGTMSARWRWPGTILLTILALLTLYGTGSQSAQLAFALGLCTAFLFPVRRRSAWLLLTILIGALLLSVPWLSQFLMHNVASSLFRVPFLGSGYGYAAARMEIWDYVSRYALQRPLQGFGMDATRAVTALTPINSTNPAPLFRIRIISRCKSGWNLA